MISNKIWTACRHLLLPCLMVGLVSSCSAILQYFNTNDELKLKQKSAPKLLCSDLTDINVIHQSKLAVREFQPVKKVLQNKYRYNFVELAMSFLVYQSIVRPDSSGLTSRLQVVLSTPTKQHYYDLNRLNNQSYQDILAVMARDFKTRPIPRLLQELKRVFPRRFTIQEAFHQFLSDNVDYLKNRQDMQDLFKLSRPLRKGETFPRRSKHFAFSRRSTRRPAPMFPMKIASDGKYELTCSFDSGLYQNGLFVVRKRHHYTNSFALNGPSGYSFMAFSSRTQKEAIQKKKKKKESKKETITPADPAPFCFYRDQLKSITVMSFDSKDPGQVLYHLINYDIFNAKNSQEVIQYLNFPRHEILSQPLRMLFESKKSSKDQLNYFLSLSIPVYHVDELGQVWTLFRQLETPGTSTTFIADSRKPPAQSCLLP